MRSPADMDILVVDITNQCFLRCSNCTRAVAHQTEKREMTPDQLRASLRSLKGWWRPGRVVGLIGGEPTLHSQFEEMCKVFREEWNPGLNPDHGKDPIDDFDQFAVQRLYDRTNGRGLWTSFGPKFIDHYEAVMDTFSHWNPNDHTAGGVHQTGLVDAKEMCEALGIPWDKFPEYRDKCWVQNQWSASITPKGNYFCEVAGTLDLLYHGGKHAWKDEADWWKRTPDQFGDQIHLCEMCSLCLPGPGQVDSRDRDVLGEGHRIRLETVGSPAVRGGRYDRFDPEVHIERREVTTKDSYTNGHRVAADNRSVRPKKISAIVTCVGRQKHFEETFHHNLRQADELIVVTDSPDGQLRWDANPYTGFATASTITRVQSPRYADRSFAFNKGALLNDGLAALAPGADWIVLTDADCFLPDNLREYVDSHSLNPGVLYGCERDNGTPGLTNVNREPNGYFQLFNRRAHAIRDKWPRVMSEAFCSAGGVDTWFMQQFPVRKQRMLPLTVRHIPHGDECSWNGSARGPCWRQVGVITKEGEYHPLKDCDWSGKRRVRVTSTLDGEWREIEATDGQMYFPAFEPGFAHLHVAMWCDNAR